MCFPPQESRDLEEKLGEQEEDEEETQSSEPPLCTIDIPIEDDDWPEFTTVPDDDVDDAEKLKGVLKLDMIKNQSTPRRKTKSDKRRKSKSAPSLRERKTSASPRKKSPGSTPRKSKMSPGRRASSAGMEKEAALKRGNRKISLKDGGRINSSSSQSSFVDTPVFSGLKGSLTSGENESMVNDSQHNDEVFSEYSDVMTITSSGAIAELASPILKRGASAQNFLNVNSSEFEEHQSRDISLLVDYRPGNRVQFDMMLETSKGTPIKSPLSDTRIDLKIMPLSEQASDNYLDPGHDYQYRTMSADDISNSKFSKDIRSRLISRVENAISPDLKKRILTGAPTTILTN